MRSPPTWYQASLITEQFMEAEHNFRMIAEQNLRPKNAVVMGLVRHYLYPNVGWELNTNSGYRMSIHLDVNAKKIKKKQIEEHFVKEVEIRMGHWKKFSNEEGRGVEFDWEFEIEYDDIFGRHDVIMTVTAFDPERRDLDERIAKRDRRENRSNQPEVQGGR